MVSAEAAIGESAVAEIRTVANKLLAKDGTLNPSFVLHGNHATPANPKGSASAASIYRSPADGLPKHRLTKSATIIQSQANMTAPLLQGKIT
ncbi:hypothetical protein NKI36_09865 [Mesorhizobium caraganae]|uniref:Uncharacterized protein n=1 Tax=Mesorhizobium caraganae TaxID=483206 RepID=A0ABV1YXF9_9HYPH